MQIFSGFFLEIVLQIDFFRRIVAFDGLCLYHARGISSLPVLTLRRHRPRHIAAREQRHSDQYGQ